MRPLPPRDICLSSICYLGSDCNLLFKDVIVYALNGLFRTLSRCSRKVDFETNQNVLLEPPKRLQLKPGVPAGGPDETHVR